MIICEKCKLNDNCICPKCNKKNLCNNFIRTSEIPNIFFKSTRDINCLNIEVLRIKQGLSTCEKYTDWITIIKKK